MGQPACGHLGQSPAIVILHLHGPALLGSLCVLKYLDSYEPLTPELLQTIRGWCDFWYPACALQLLVDAHYADSGALFRTSYVLFSQYLDEAHAQERPTNLWQMME